MISCEHGWKGMQTDSVMRDTREWLSCAVPVRFMLVTAVTLDLGATQLPPSGNPLPIRGVESCRIEFTDRGRASLQGRWGGQIAQYEVTTAGTGKPIVLKRQVIKGREHLPPLVRLDQFEACVREWDFGGSGAFSVRLLGGALYDGIWVIDVMQGDRIFRLRLPVGPLNP